MRKHGRSDVPLFPDLPRLWLAAVAGLLVAGALVPALADPKVVFEQDFTTLKDGTTAAELGWTVEAAPDESLYVVEKGALKVTCFHKPYKGGGIHRQVSVVRKGRLEFEASIGDANNEHLSLIISLYNFMTSFKGYGSYRLCWDRYCPDFDVNKTKYPWAGVANRITPDAFHRFVIEFDADIPRIEYFVDDMDDPTFIDADVPVLKEGANTLRLGNYGLCAGTVLCYLRNLRLLEGGAAVSTQAEATKQPLVVDGYGFTPYRVDEALVSGGAPKAKHYLMELGLGLQPKIGTALARLIGTRSLSGADLIVLSDVTADSLGTELITRLDDWVKGGGSLLVLGGYFTFGKGRFKGTPLEALMPVEVVGPWEVRKADTPLVLEAGRDWPRGAALDWSTKPAAFYYHDLKPKPGSRVLVQAGKVPLLTMWSRERGKVAAFTGTTAGVAAPGVVPFWEWKDWSSLLGAVIRELRGEP